MIASCSTGTTATVVAMLVERALDPGERVAAYSPEFAANRKEQATIEMVAAHIVGLPYPPLGTVCGAWTSTAGKRSPRRWLPPRRCGRQAPPWPITPSPTARCWTRSFGEPPASASRTTCRP
jgi:CubicO group peptidase (beta-lactamase class C family)